MKKIKVGDIVFTKISDGYGRSLGKAKVVGINKFLWFNIYLLENSVTWIDKEYTEKFYSKKFRFQITKI